jgi:hypothetical protein
MLVARLDAVRSTIDAYDDSMVAAPSSRLRGVSISER